MCFSSGGLFIRLLYSVVLHNKNVWNLPTCKLLAQTIYRGCFPNKKEQFIPIFWGDHLLVEKKYEKKRISIYVMINLTTSMENMLDFGNLILLQFSSKRVLHHTTFSL